MKRWPERLVDLVFDCLDVLAAARPRLRFTDAEITLCTYAALYDASDFGGVDAIRRLERRKLASIKLKIRKIAAMLDESRILRYSNVVALKDGRRGNKCGRAGWDVVLSLTKITRGELLDRCFELLPSEP